MNKNDLIAEVARKSGLSKRQAADAVEAVFETISTELKNGQSVRLLGFGSFGVAERGATEARNPQTGQTVQIPARTVPKFTPGKNLLRSVAVEGDPTSDP